MTFWFFQKQSILAQSTKERRCKVSLFSSETPEKYKLNSRFIGKKSVDNTLRRFLTKNIWFGYRLKYFAQNSDQEYWVWKSAEVRTVEISWKLFFLFVGNFASVVKSKNAKQRLEISFDFYMPNVGAPSM